MRFSIFELNEPIPSLRASHAIAILRPWIDAGSVGTLTLERLEAIFEAEELGKLARPGTFFDFTRYRPVTSIRNDVRQLVIPNSTILYATRRTEHDFIFLNLLEPHVHGEVYADAVLNILKKFAVQRYCLLGSFYDMVPHTRPLMVSGSASNPSLMHNLEQAGVHSSSYQGPTTICNLITQEASKIGIETITLMVHLPQYSGFEEDYTGLVRLLRILSYMYYIKVEESDIFKSESQIKSIDFAVEKDSKLKTALKHLEADYDTRVAASEKDKKPRLSPEVEKFLKEMEKRFKER